MSKLKITTALLAGFFLAVAGSARSQTVDNTSRFTFDSASVYGSLAGVVFKRSNPGGGAVVAANPAGTPFLNGTDYRFGRGLGLDGTIGVRFFRWEALEARLLNFGSTSATPISFRTPGAFIGAGFTGPANTLFDSQYQTSLTSWELNWRHQLFDQLTLIAGVRSIKVHDSLSYLINTTVANATYNYDNMLRGGQIGADLSILPSSYPFQVNVVGKIGKYSLHTGGGIFEGQGGNTPIGSFATNMSDQVYASEVGISAGYKLSNHVLIRGGYQWLRIENIGLASNNAAASLLNPSLLRANVYRDNLTFQGVNFGALVSW